MILIFEVWKGLGRFGSPRLGGLCEVSQRFVKGGN